MGTNYAERVWRDHRGGFLLYLCVRWTAAAATAAAATANKPNRCGYCVFVDTQNTAQFTIARCELDRVINHIYIHICDICSLWHVVLIV